MRETLKRENGITLVALIVTIIVLLILASISMGMLIGNNGIITGSNNAKQQAETASEKEMLELATTAVMGKEKYGTITGSKLQETLDSVVGIGKVEVQATGTDYEVYFIESQRYYEVNQDGNVGNPQTVIKDSNPGDITKGNTLDGSQEKPYQINCIEDLIEFSNRTINGENFDGKYIMLARSLNFNSNFSYADYTNIDMFGDYNGDGTTEGIKQELTNQQANGFKPMEQFQGTFLGNNCEIKNVYMKHDLISTNIIGFFRENTGIIENLNVSGQLEFNVATGSNRIFAIGGIVGYSEGTIRNVENHVGITGQIQTGTGWLYIGGITGYFDEAGIMENSCNKGNFVIGGTGDNRVGGIVGGLTRGATIRNCYNEADTIRVESTDYACVGGIVSESQSNCTIENCYNNGKLEAIGKTRVYLGGITSMSQNSTITKCYNAGQLVGNGYAPRIGGIDGSPEGCSIFNCYNTGTIETTENSSVIRAGGIIGEVLRSGITLENSYNVGKFNLKGAVNNKGGIYAILIGNINNCYYLEQEGFDIGSSMNTANSSVENSSSKTSDEMKANEFLTLLNKSEENFKKDTNLMNNGYPILNWQ